MVVGFVYWWLSHGRKPPKIWRIQYASNVSPLPSSMDETSYGYLISWVRSGTRAPTVWRNAAEKLTCDWEPFSVRGPRRFFIFILMSSIFFSVRGMAKGIIWATAEDLARNRGRVISLYRQILRSLNSPNLPLSFAARLAKKAEVRGIFLLASEDRSLHNIEDLIDTAEYSLSLLRKGEIPKYIQWVTLDSLMAILC